MVTYEEIEEIFVKITESFNEPIPIGGRCESSVYYHTADLTDDDLSKCAEYAVDRINKVLGNQQVDVFLKLPTEHSYFAEKLYLMYQDFNPQATDVVFDTYSPVAITNGMGEKYRGKNTVLINDVITTARSTLEAHGKATLRGIPVLAWTTLIDRTFGPGPVPVISAFTGASVRVMTNLA
jgi:hypothetical protein